LSISWLLGVVVVVVTQVVVEVQAGSGSEQGLVLPLEQATP
jgi:hypothetical protein